MHQTLQHWRAKTGREPKKRTSVSSSTAGWLTYGYERWARLKFWIGITRRSERLAAVEHCCQDNASVRAGKKIPFVELTSAGQTQERGD